MPSCAAIAASISVFSSYPRPRISYPPSRIRCSGRSDSLSKPSDKMFGPVG